MWRGKASTASTRATAGDRCGDAGSARERGSVLMLMPAGVLILIVLAAIAVDAAILFTGERQIADAVAAAANDAAVAGLSESSFYDCGDLRVDPEKARAVAAASYVARSADIFEGSVPAVSVGTAPDGRLTSVTVSATAQVRLIFSQALPGGAAVRTVGATAVATAAQDPGSAAPAADC